MQSPSEEVAAGDWLALLIDHTVLIPGRAVSYWDNAARSKHVAGRLLQCGQLLRTTGNKQTTTHALLCRLGNLIGKCADLLPLVGPATHACTSAHLAA